MASRKPNVLQTAKERDAALLGRQFESAGLGAILAARPGGADATRAVALGRVLLARRGRPQDPLELGLVQGGLLLGALALALLLARPLLPGVFLKDKTGPVDAGDNQA